LGEACCPSRRFITTNNKLEEFAPFFYPKSHAVIGASADQQKLGGRFVGILLSFGYNGKLYPVNPNEGQILGLKTYSRVGDIPDSVDLATITIPARGVPQAVEECLAKGIKAVQIVTSGFKERSEEGQKLEEQMAKTAARGIRIIGPNGFGVYSPSGNLTFMPGADLPRESGPVAFICQSGGISYRVAGRGSGLGIRFSRVVSFGNACDVNESDLLEYLKEDPETKIITAYIEGVKDGPRFFKLLQETTKTKPVIIWKGGLSRAGARAARTHSASLGGDESVWDAVFKQTGAIRVNNIDELLDTTLAFLYLAPHRGRKVSVVGGGGGVIVNAADTCERAGLSLPPFSTELQKKLLAVLPPVGTSAPNPVDMGTPSPPPNAFKTALETVFTEGGVDTVIIDTIHMSLLPSGFRNGNEERQSTLMETAQIPVDVKKRLGKPIMMVMPVGSTGADTMELEGARRKASDYYLSQGIPVFLTLERVVKALVNLVGYYERHDAILSSDLSNQKCKS